MSFNPYLFLCIVLKLIVLNDSEDEVTTESTTPTNMQWMHHLLPHDYTPNLPPSYAMNVHGGGNATEIKCSILPKSITGISIKTMDFDVDLDIEIRWIDPRITIPPDVSDNSTTTVLKSVAAQMWIPRISFRNCKLCDEFLFTRQNTLSISPVTKELSVGFRKVYKFVCSFDLSYYPFDYQICFIKIDALYTNNLVLLVHYIFEDEGFSYDVNVPPEFILISYNITDQDCSISRNTSHGQRSCLKHTFIFRRIIAHYLMLMYGPSILIVILSWVSFWFDVEAIAPRVGLALTSLLTLATQFSNAQTNVPLVASIKAIDIWMFACIVMVTASLIEFSFAQYFYRLNKANKINVDSIPHIEKKILQVEDEKPKCYFKFSLRTKIDTCVMDNVSRVLFPSMFIIFNIFYWTYYQSAGVITGE